MADTFLLLGGRLRSMSRLFANSTVTNIMGHVSVMSVYPSDIYWPVQEQKCILVTIRISISTNALHALHALSPPVGGSIRPWYHFIYSRILSTYITWQFLSAEKACIDWNKKQRLLPHFYWTKLLLQLVGFIVCSGSFIIIRRYISMRKPMRFTLPLLTLQLYHSCKRNSVEGFNFDFGGMTITSATAYMIFNVGLFWIPQVQVTHAWSYIHKHCTCCYVSFSSFRSST